ncbi:PREDICTED: vacuolar protein sorting-associated protein 41 homolog [Lupinus angustifolius]|nr:PREDICTED: vacuolar protein sorting-associated protein 41 homolog [Lupinus angustifolius]
MLLEHTVGNLDPLYIVNKVPNGLEIPRLRDRLVKIITDYRTETSLRQGCNDILKEDCVNLLIKYYKEAKHGISLNNEDGPRIKRSHSQASQVLEKSLSLRTGEVKSKASGGGRCCICFDPFYIQNVSVTVFFCCHAYHTTCLMDSSYTSSSSKKENESTSQGAEMYDGYNGYMDNDSNDDEETESGGPFMRCILCTTATS